VAQLPVVDIEMSEAQEDSLKQQLRDQLGPALETHEQREQKYARFKRLYKARPEHEVKNFPWPNCSNVVIPIVAISVDSIVARLMKAVLGSPNLVEAKILEGSIEGLEKDVRDWADLFFGKSGARDTCRTMFHDMAVDGDAFIKCTWSEQQRMYHAYGADGQVFAGLKTDYEGPVWHSVPAADIIRPEGWDDWKKLPWIAERLRWTWVEIRQLVDQNFLRREILETLKARQTSERQDPRQRETQRAQEVVGQQGKFHTFYEIWGKFEVPPEKNDASDNRTPDELGTVVEECILTYNHEYNVLGRAVYNPHFAKARYIVRIPYLVQPHEIDGQGVVEQSEQFQLEASTAHNQTIDAATAAIAGIVVRKSTVNMGAQEDIFPGKQLVADEPDDDVKIIHLSMGNSTLPNVEQSAAFWNEKRTGVSAYNMGVESPIAGSRATATGTTALIGEGNQRFWVSIDDMRSALEELYYLTIGLEQQMRPEGTPISASRMLQWPQGDVRSIIGLTLTLTSEKVNKDLEIQNFQLLMTVLNDYYARVMQLGGMLLNPQFPPQQKELAIKVMTAAQNLVKRFVERFDVENVDELVPGIMQATEMMGGMLGPGQMAGGAPQIPGAGAGAPPPGPPGMPPPPGGGAGI
jgi:hypothetical protein